MGRSEVYRSFRRATASRAKLALAHNLSIARSRIRFPIALSAEVMSRQANVGFRRSTRRHWHDECRNRTSCHLSTDNVRHEKKMRESGAMQMMNVVVMIPPIPSSQQQTPNPTLAMMTPITRSAALSPSSPRTTHHANSLPPVPIFAPTPLSL